MAASTESKSRARRILLADDSECVRNIIRKSLETQPMLRVCGEAVDGMDAIEQAHKLKPEALEEIRLLGNLPSLQIVLAGQNELIDRILRPIGLLHGG